MITFKELKRNLKKDNPSLPVIKVSVVGDTATQFLATAIQGEAIERGYRIDMFEAEYSQVERQVMDPTSDLYQFGAKYNIIFQSTHKLLEKYSLLPASEWGNLAEERLAFVRTICESVQGKIIYYNYPEIGDGVFGSYENKVPSSFIYQIRKINLGLMELAQEILRVGSSLICKSRQNEEMRTVASS